MSERKLGRGRLSSTVRARVGDEESVIDLPMHELELRPLKYQQRYQIHLAEGVPLARVPRAIYTCTHCGEAFLYIDIKRAQKQRCPRR